MDAVRLFLRSNSLRLSSKRDKSFANKFASRSNSPVIFSSANEDNRSVSSDKIKSFVTNSASSSALSPLPTIQLDSESCSGLSTPSAEHARSAVVVASAWESISDVVTFTGSHISKRRRSSHVNDTRRCSLLAEPSAAPPGCLSSPPFRRSKSHRPPERLRRHSIKLKHLSVKHAQKHSQPFQSTYRQRNEEFQRLFKDVPDSERLIVDYSCAWQKDILVQGRMYLSANYLCFYANILNWKSHLCLKLDEITGITREKTAKVISNAIELKTNKGDRFFFASFVTRDKTYAIMHRLWQAVNDNKPISIQQTWTLIHESYGDDLGMTTDEDDTHSRSSRNSQPPKQSTKASPQSLDKYDRLTPSSIVTNSFQGEDDQSSLSSRGEHPSDEEGTSPIGDDARTNTLMHRPRSAAGEHESSPTTSSSLLARPDIPYLTQCPCDAHLATELINQTYPMSVERLYDCIFGDNDFLIAYRASRRIKDYQAGEWALNEETGKRERMLNYKVTVSTVFSSTTICSNERQIIDCEQPMSHYILDTEVRNEGIKYADAFFVASRYCLVQTGPQRSHLKLTCEVKYVKSLMAIIKSFIEKNAMAALQDSFTDLMKRIEQESSKRSRAHSVNNNQESEEAVQPSPPTARRLSCQLNEQQPLEDSALSAQDLLLESRHEPAPTQESRSRPTPIVSNAFHSSRINYFIPFSFVTMLLLLILNIFLWIKLNQIDRMTDRLIRSQPSWLHQYSSRPEENQWTSLLKTQEEFYQMQLDSLHSVLLSTHQALRNVTDTLKQLSTR